MRNDRDGLNAVLEQDDETGEDDEELGPPDNDLDSLRSLFAAAVINSAPRAFTFGKEAVQAQVVRDDSSVPVRLLTPSLQTLNHSTSCRPF